MNRPVLHTHNTSRTHSYTKNNRKALPCAVSQSTIESDVCYSQAKVEVRGKMCRHITTEKRTAGGRSVTGLFAGLQERSSKWQSNSWDDILFKNVMTEWSHVSVTVAAAGPGVSYYSLLSHCLSWWSLWALLVMGYDEFVWLIIGSPMSAHVMQIFMSSRST